MRVFGKKILIFDRQMVRGVRNEAFQKTCLIHRTRGVPLCLVGVCDIPDLSRPKRQWFHA